MSNRAYQLTKHPVGSMWEIWALSWPLMLGLISSSLMIFIDRLLLSWYSPLALNAGTNAGMAYYAVLIIPISICSISEVFVGRLHGEGNLSRIGNAVWQMVWFSWMLTPLFFLVAFGLPNLIFFKSTNILYESIYFKWVTLFAPFSCMSIALCGFFIGIGRVRLVTLCSVLANLLNAVLGYLLIFGWGDFIPSLGIVGAGIATGVAQVCQALLLLLFFLRRDNRKRYGTSNYRYDSNYFRESINIGAPAGLGHAIELLAHYAFFRLVMTVGSEQMTIVALVQSFYILFSFITEGQSKGVSAIIANLIGAKKYEHTGRVLWSALKLHLCFSLLLGLLFFFTSSHLLSLFIPANDANLLDSASFISSFHKSLLWMALFFLFDGFGWILIGLLTSAGDTKFIFYVSSLIHWAAFVLPAFFLIGVGKQGASVAWMIIAMYSAINFSLYLWRYKSGGWLRNYSQNLSKRGVEVK